MFSIAGHTITIVPVSAGNHRVEVDGRAVPMRHTVTSSTRTNSGRSTQVLVAPHLADSVPLGALVDGAEGCAPSVTRSSEGGWYVFVTRVTAHGEVYNTAVYEQQSIALRFPDDFSEVHVVSDTHVDLSD